MTRISAVTALATIDNRLLIWLRTRGHGPRRDRAVSAYSRLGEHAACWLALGAVGAVADAPRRRRWLRGTAAVGISVALNYVVKLVVRRPRPQLAGLAPLSPVVSGLSFPSAHATTSFTAAGAYRGLLPAAALYGPAAVFAISRPYLGVHYPSDVLAGMALGSVLGALGGGI